MFWNQCTKCIFGTNSPILAAKHERETGHTVQEEAE